MPGTNGRRLALALACAASLAACARESVYARAERLLEAADADRKKGDMAAALKALHQGIDLLGDRYASPDLVDDTGLKLTLADVNESQGMLDSAFATRRIVLADRLATCAEKPGCKEAR